MSDSPIYRLTSLGRPLDPAWPSNKAVLIVIPVAAVLGWIWGAWQGGTALDILLRGLVFAASVFGCWALGRELLPDDQAAAFVSLALGLLACLLLPAPGLLTLFASLLLVRVVNRSTGQVCRTLDSWLVLLLVIATVYSTDSPWFAAVGATAFLLDAVLKRPQRRQVAFALLCLATMAVYVIDHDSSLLVLSAPASLAQWLAIAVVVLFGLHLLLLRKVHARGDVDQRKLDADRVKGGMAVAILATLQGLNEMPEVALLVASLAGLCLAMAFRRAFRSSSKGLRSA